MEKRERTWAKAVGIKKTAYRTKVGNREQIVYADKSGGLYAIEKGKYIPIFHSMCYTKAE